MIIDIFTFVVLLFSIALHEVAHGWVAYRLGDPTAKYEGRLTLNPLKHLDPIGSFLFPAFLFLITGGRGPIFGWAKPVPINPYNFRDQKMGKLKVAIAGPLSNLGLALIAGLLMKLFLGVNVVYQVLAVIVIINLALAIFNLFPVPPLDGSHILLGLSGKHSLVIESFFQRYGLVLLILFILFGMDLVSFLIGFLFNLLVG
jgi:Zn-dependent protease